MFRILYTALLYLVTPGALLWFAYRGLADPRYRRGWGQRLGWADFRRADYWLHAASVGEVQAALPVLQALRRRHPDADILVTTVTPTGAEKLRSLLGDSVRHSYLPIDLPGAVGRFLSGVRPRAGIIMEVELWPNLLLGAARRGIPLYLANARMSERSVRRYRRLGVLTARVLSAFTAIAAQTAADAERFRRLAPAARVTETGNVKFDVLPPVDLEPRSREIARLAAADRRPVWVAGSTREGEEGLLLDAHERLRRRFPDAVLILVPRHPERFDGVERLCRERAIGVRRRSAGQPVQAGDAVLLGDTMGELQAYYAAGRVAFVGGTLVPVGGHNVLEPAAVGRAVVVGPHVENVAAAVEMLRSEAALLQVGGAAELADALAGCMAQDGHGRLRGERGAALVGANRGSVQRLLALMEPGGDADPATGPGRPDRPRRPGAARR